MPTIAALTSFTANTQAKAAEVNANFSTIRTTVNTYCAFVDTSATISGAWTFSTAPTISGALTLGAQLTISTGGAAITGNSTVTGTLGVSGLLTASAGVTVTGTVTATTFSGSGASLTSIPASAIASGTLDSARLPTTFSSATTFSAGGAAVVVSGGGRINFSANGTENTTDLLAFNLQYTTTGGATAPAMNTAPAAGDTWRWVRVSYNGSTAWLPMLVDATP